MDYLRARQFVCRGDCVRSAAGDGAHPGATNRRAANRCTTNCGARCESRPVSGPSHDERSAAIWTERQPRRRIGDRGEDRRTTVSSTPGMDLHAG
jgi:hypothetical protein